MCFAVKDLICVHIFRCLRCKSSAPDTPERCSHSSISSPKVRLRKFSSIPNSYELFPDEMGSNRAGEINRNTYSEDGETVSITKNSLFTTQRNGTDTPSKQNLQTPEYVKKTAKLFETVQITKNVKNGECETFVLESRNQTNETDLRKTERETLRISLDCLDGEYNKKPSYVGVSCSNSGYRNVINYDSKLREGFWSANSQRESLVLSSSRLRENSPLRRDFDLKSHKGWSRDSAKVADVRIGKEAAAPVNGVSRPEKFVNISTSTKTISTFRSSKDVKTEENAVNGGMRHSDGRCSDESKVNLKQILNGKSNEPYRKGYNNLGFSPKILKSPEKNCNSFLKSISSFENNCKMSQTGKSPSYAKSEQRVYDSSNSIQQRIERLYGPGALAQGFYTQKSQPLKTDMLDKSNECSPSSPIEISPQNKTHIPVSTPVSSTTNSANSLKPVSVEAAPTESCSTNHSASEPVPEPENEAKDGHYFLRLLKKETDRLEQLASFAESELENGENLPEEISGKLRAAAGKARLLVCQKLHQFEGLCHKNLNEKPGEQFPTTSEDLAGFWDMVMLQVVQIYGVFDELEELKNNNWKAISTKKESASPVVVNGQSQQTKTTPKKCTPPSATAEKQNQKSDSAKKAREEGRRKLLEERRKKMKELKENKFVNADNEVEIFAK